MWGTDGAVFGDGVPHGMRCLWMVGMGCGLFAGLVEVGSCIREKSVWNFGS